MTAASPKRKLAGLLSLPRVVGAGIGPKQQAGITVADRSVVVLVERKLPKGRIPERELIPVHVDGIETDVVEVGTLWANVAPSYLHSRQRRYRPLWPGCSLAHYDAAAGSLGFTVLRGGRRYLLSCNHVLANTNTARPGDAILQPAPMDGGKVDGDEVATLYAYVPLAFEPARRAAGWFARLFRKSNRVDAALAFPIDHSLLPTYVTLPTGKRRAVPGMTVFKYGRTSGWTVGTVRAVDVRLRLYYRVPAGRKTTVRTAFFNDQILAEPMSQRGDSGACVQDPSGRAVGLLIAGSDRATVVTPVALIESELRCTIMTQGGVP